MLLTGTESIRDVVLFRTPDVAIRDIFVRPLLDKSDYKTGVLDGEITLKTATETIKGNVTKTQKGMGLMFDAKQMTNILQKEGKVSNAAAVQAVSKLAKSADGARVGFELTK